MSAEQRGVPREGPPIACDPTGVPQHARRKHFHRAQRVLCGYESIAELEDGYEYVFPQEESRAEELVRFVAFERKCCPFFTFEIVFEQEGGPVSLRMRGPEGTKEFMAEYVVDENEWR